MYDILRIRNQHLLRDLDRLSREIASAEFPRELLPYSQKVASLCDTLRRRIERNLLDLDLKQDSILEDILSNTAQVLQFFDLLSTRMSTPILRASSSDRLSLRTVAWLHQSHPSTTVYSAAVSSGSCGVWTFIQFCPVYSFPTAEQTSLLYLPLYFHEFGHLLYRCHQEEMDDLVRDLQRQVYAMLTPSSNRGDRHSQAQRAQREAIVGTWYHWAQELFCDAVGLAVGGASYLWAFSLYLSRLHRDAFYRSPDRLRVSHHPPTWLRIKLLHSQAVDAGLSSHSHEVVQDWDRTAALMGVTEDYHGYYDQAFEPSVLRMLGDALTEVQPRPYLPAEASGTTLFPDSDDTPITLVHRAWTAFFADNLDYSQWESEAIERWIGSSRPA